MAVRHSVCSHSNTSQAIGAGAIRLIASILLAGTLAAPSVFAATCESLVPLNLADTTITSAMPVPGPSFTAPDGQTYSELPSFCEVSAVLTPTSDSMINMNLWMPTTSWNGRFEGTG